MRRRNASAAVSASDDFRPGPGDNHFGCSVRIPSKNINSLQRMSALASPLLGEPAAPRFRASPRDLRAWYLSALLEEGTTP